VQQEAEVAGKDLETDRDLRYLEADSVSCPAGTLADFRVETQDAEALGSVSGVLISPATRRCEYFVIESPGFFSHRRYLVPVDAGATLEDEPKCLRISARKDELDLQAFTPSSVPEFTDDDLLKAMFTRDAA
jgi:hypothetical protein